MTHHENLKVLVFISNDQSLLEDVLSYFTENGYPKVQADGIESQIEHLAQAGQHRIVSNEIDNFESFKLLESSFPGSVQLIGVTQKDGGMPNTSEHSSFMGHADHHLGIKNDQPLADQLEAFIETVDFSL